MTLEANIRAGFDAVATDIGILRAMTGRSVKQYGAIGDGVADDTDAIEAAEAAAYAADVDLIFPGGDYRITRDVVLRRPMVSSGYVRLSATRSSDVDPAIKLTVARRMSLERFTFDYLVVEVGGTSPQSFIPTTVEGCHFLDARLVVGQDSIASRGYAIKGNTFAADMSRYSSAIKLVNASGVNVSDNNIQDYAEGVQITPSLSFANNSIKISQNIISNCLQHIEILGTSIHRVSGVKISGNTLSGSNREAANANNSGVIALFCSNLKIENNPVISHKGDLLKLQACLGVRVRGNTFNQLANYPAFRTGGCVDMIFSKNTFYQSESGGYVGLILDHSFSSLVSGNDYDSAEFVFTDNVVHCVNQALKIEDTRNAKVIRNTFHAREATNSYTKIVWFAPGTTEGLLYGNSFYAPSGDAYRNDIGTELQTSAPAQSVQTRAFAAPSVSSPVITNSDAALNNAKSYVVEFTLSRVEQLGHLVDSGNKQTISQWMSGVSGATLAWNSSAWNTSDGKTGDVVANGGVTDTYGLEDQWWAQSAVVIDRANRLSCRDWASPDSEPVLTHPMHIGAVAVAERAWVSATFRPPLVVDGALYDPAATGLMSGTYGYSGELSGRMSLGQKADGTYVLCAVDGKTGVSGCTMEQLANKMLNLGCVQAYNLDGGGSASLWYQGSLLNSPSDAGGERAIPAVMYV